MKFIDVVYAIAFTLIAVAIAGLICACAIFEMAGLSVLWW